MSPIGYTTGEYKTIVANILGNDNIGTFIDTWLTLSSRQIAVRNPNLLRKYRVDLTISSSADAQYVYPSVAASPPVFGIVGVNLLDENDDEDDAGWLTRTTLDKIWAMENKARISSELRRPYYWAPSGIVLENFDSQTGDDGKLSFRIYPQPTAAPYAGRKLRVSYYLYPPLADVSGDSTIGAEWAQAKKAMLEGLLRYAYLYNSDIPGYLVARAEQRKALKRMRTAFSSAAGRRGTLGGGRFR